jgi:hypothetical protein
MPTLNSLFDHTHPTARSHQGRERPDSVSIARQPHSLDTSHENTVHSSPGFPKSIPSLQRQATTAAAAAPGDTPAADDERTAADRKTSLFSDPAAQSYAAIQVVSQGTSDSGRILTCTEPSCQNLTFSNKDEWTKHMNKHNRPFKCTVAGCEKSFARNACRQRHLDSVHNHKAKFYCDVPECKHSRVGFARRDHLKQHIPTHARGVGSSAAVDQVPDLSDTAAVEARVEVWSPRKRVRVSEVQTEAALQVSSDAEAEIWRLKNVEKELWTEIKRLKETVDKQTDIIYSLTRRSS